MGTKHIVLTVLSVSPEEKKISVEFLKNVLVQEPVIGLIKWLKPKGLKVCSYVEKCAEFKNQTLKKSAGTQKCYAQWNIPGV